MQFHFDGFRPGDPKIAPTSSPASSPASSNAAAQATPQDVDVLIIGCGPAGLTLGAQLARFGDLSVRIAERKSGPLQIGQADGIACRSMEMFQAFGFAHDIAQEGYWVNETAFWRPGDDGRIARADRIDDVEHDLSEMPHVILSQARVHDHFLAQMANGPRHLRPDYDMELTGLTRGDGPYPLRAEFGDQIINAKYVVGCDGARSAVRRALGYDLEGQAARQLWGVMDILAVTDFPDIRLKCAIQSADAGSLLIIPREGGAMVRMYIQLDALTGEERAADRCVTADQLIEQALAILAPYRLDVRQVAWSSAYEIGQRLCPWFDDLKGGAGDPRIFIAGDAGHTHSPKAGQGMNVSMADSFNLGWKLAAVLRGQAGPELLRSYSEERHAKAAELIDFDRELAGMIAAKDTGSEARFQAYFEKHARYTAGVETTYAPSVLIGGGQHQALATGQSLGKRFHSAPAIRLADAKPMQLGHAFEADGRWRLLAFAGRGDLGQPGQPIAQLCAHLETASDSPILSYTPQGKDRDAVIDLRAVFQADHRDMDLTALPGLLLPAKGAFGLTDYEKVFCADPKRGDIYAMRRIDRARGALLVLRPDQYVANVLPLNGFKPLAQFFAGFMKPASRAD